MTISPRQTPEARELHTRRLLMRPFTEEEIEAVIDGVSLEHFGDGFPIPESVDQLKNLAQAGGFYFTETMYAPLACVELETGLIIGSSGFASAPIGGSLEVVGFLAPGRRHRGYGAEILNALVDLAFENPDVSMVRASVPQDNEHIEQLLRDAGFRITETVGPEAEYRRFRS